ncbi:Thymidylate kinase [Puccinia graminis f. sp. tritici]|uniref:Thymidylate kinase n=1 Tax=Puccinia graminis f. sp. tritici TaxID=56615 RepID=A0A5B0NVN8_PUCGR|nr:Thymidylate kinase [Puccinia graminis f. sp. tritici]
MANTTQRGSFIVFEGLDRSGKSTQCRRLEEKLKQAGRTVESIRFPDRTTAIGQMINSYLCQTSELDDHAIHLLFAANRWEKSADIHTTLRSGTTIICDRYAFSGTAFTAAKFSIRTPPEPEPIATLACADRGLPLPDLVIFLTLGDQSLDNREGFGRERYENTELQDEVKRQFTQVVRPYFEEIHGRDRWVNVDATGTIEEVEQRIWHVVDNHLQNFVPQSTGKLWVA